MWDWFIYSNNGILTTDRCKPFDSAADGYVADPAVPFILLLTSITFSFVRGEGAVAIVIKPLEAALADNDHIYAVVRSSSLSPSSLPHCIRDRFWALPSTTTGQIRRFPSPPGSYNNSASVTPSRTPAGIPVKLIMWNYTRLVCYFRQNPPYCSFNLAFGLSGTTVGDPIEANAVGEVFHRNDDLIVGSVKGNLGYVYLARR